MVIDRNHRAARIAWPGSATGGRRVRSTIISVCIWLAAVAAGLAVTIAAEPAGVVATGVARDAGSPVADTGAIAGTPTDRFELAGHRNGGR